MPDFIAPLPPLRDVGDSGPASDMNSVAAAILELRAALLAAPTVVIHGTNTAMARPATTGPVIWFGTVRPTNLADGDVYQPVTAES